MGARRVWVDTDTGERWLMLTEADFKEAIRDARIATFFAARELKWLRDERAYPTVEDYLKARGE